MYNTKNKKVTQHSGIQCVNWDEATEGEKSFLGRKDSEVWKYQGEANMAKKKNETTEAGRLLFSQQASQIIMCKLYLFFK